MSLRPRNGLGVEHEVVPFEQTSDAGFVNLHLQAADAECAKRLGPTPLHPIVVDLDAFDSQRRNGIQIGSNPQSGAPGPCITWHDLNAWRAGVEEHLCALDHGRGA